MTGSPRTLQRNPAKRREILLTLLIAISLLFGAGGTPAPLGEAVAIVAAALILAYAFSTGLLDAVPRIHWAFAAALPLLALIQLVPLPPSLWQMLPLRQVLSGATAANGHAGEWRPLSMDPLSTAWSLASFAPPLAAFVLSLSLTREARQRMVMVVVVACGASAVLAGMQLLLGDAIFLHPRSIDAGESGFFANQNTQATFLACGAFGLGVLLTEFGNARQSRSLIALGMAALIVTGLLLSGSRSGFLLLALAAAILALLALKRFKGNSRRLFWFAASGLLLLALGGWIVADQSGISALDDLLNRFQSGSDGRFSAIWPDASWLAQALWPAGSGLGTFVHVFGLAERLEVVDATFANRAHNDWLEFAIETGVAGIVALLLMIAFLGRALWQARAMRWDAAMQWALFTIVAIAAHSLVDYPLRAIAMSVIGALAVGLLLSSPNVDTQTDVDP
ncbi:O-antigen ligase family protein [Qipengyuania flava]|uniref:O-antigen ligase family protein n=1 Tax=Qipengyuania flava TaxID=192812 RepID=UPI001CD36181|nr:O-antigen ligase family protein [Qipengyuania flava]MCA0889539.1 O-antigen ligase family protein [Qipengyuania flava]